MTWPELGVCGACARPARRFPSGRWEHDGRPCALRYSSGVALVFGMPDPPAVFVPDGDELPRYTSRQWPWLPGPADPDTGLPEHIGLINPRDVDAWWDRVRERLRDEAENGERA